MMTPAEGAVIERLARGEAVPGAPGACGREGCAHGKPWHKGKTRLKPCEVCGCESWAAREG